MKLSFRNWVVVAPLAAFLLLWPRSAAVHAAQVANAAPAPAGSADKGKQAFAANSCNTCHGEEAEGAMGPKLAATEKTFSEFLAVLRKPKGAMPPFTAATVPDAQAADLYAFVKSLGTPSEAKATGAGPSATAAAAIPETFAPTAPGNAQHGKTIFVAYGCYQCHGLAGQGATQTGAPRIGPPPIPVAAFAAYIRHPTGNMPPYAAKAVPDNDVADLYAFLQAIKTPTPAKDIPLLNQ